ncbi:MAG: rhomboid family intramembrane serine protease [Actinomycetota bacterium]
MEAMPSDRRTRWEPLLRHGFGLILVALAVIWVVEIVDTVVLDDRLQGNGIIPRRSEGLDGILWAPFLHSNFGHVWSNSIPLVVLGGLVSVRGFRYWAVVTAMAFFVGGGLTWALAGTGNHIGASGVVFGYFGAVLGAAWFERRPRPLAAALLAIFLYSGFVAGLVPQEGISWEGHLFGLLAGVVAAKLMAEPRRRRGEDDPSKVQPWEADEPWLDN